MPRQHAEYLVCDVAGTRPVGTRDGSDAAGSPVHPSTSGVCVDPAQVGEATRHRHAAVFIDRILRGMKAGEIPIEQPTKLELMVNVKTAKALNLVLPKSLMIRAREKPTSAVCSADN